jgi:hypothetical protein
MSLMVFRGEKEMAALVIVIRVAILFTAVLNYCPNLSLYSSDEMNALTSSAWM